MAGIFGFFIFDGGGLRSVDFEGIEEILDISEGLQAVRTEGAVVFIDGPCGSAAAGAAEMIGGDAEVEHG
jgi:hypothetical protein